MVRRLEHITGEEVLRELDLFCREKRRPGGWGNLIAASNHLNLTSNLNYSVILQYSILILSLSNQTHPNKLYSNKKIKFLEETTCF